MYYLKRHNGNYQDFSIEQCKGYDSSAPLDIHIIRAQEEKDLAEAIANRFENSVLSEDADIEETYFYIRPVGEEFGYVINVISEYNGERI